MKKKIFTSVIVTVTFALVIITSFFVLFYNVNEMNEIKRDLKDFNEYLIKTDIENENLINNYRIKGNNVRCTIIGVDGAVLFDNENDNLDNHSDREEIVQAFETGEGYATRMSTTKNIKMCYYATKLSDGRVLRSALPFEVTNFFIKDNIIYCFVIVIIVLTFSILFSMKIVRTLTEPLKELEVVTKRIAAGDINIRVKLSTNDEIGALGKTFNNMADQLQSKIKEVVDKQGRLESILTSMESGVIAVDNEEKVIVINPYAKKVFGIREDIEGEKISDYIKDYDINSFLRDNDDAEKEVKIFHPMMKELKIKKALIHNGKDSIGKVIAVQDISDLKRLENMRSQFVANVSHELKTPLTSIKGFAETLKYVEDDETRVKFLDIINKEAERLSRLINDTLVLSKIESCPIGEVEEFCPTAMINDVIKVVRPQAEIKNINIEFDDKNEALLTASKDKFYQVILNLVENAIKYSGNGAKVNIKSYNIGREYVFSVSDTGQGIPKEDIPRIFERFYRVDKSRKSGGTGLGLAIVKHIVKTFNGDISVESEINKGSTFTVKFTNE
ncbi:MAG: HAMP domain-containing protein [Clostridiales bacterium]|nr:HAMP domain-containing protein [Clostridiales bacterium]